MTDSPKDRAEELLAERDFLLARANCAGSCSFANERWTGWSSNGLVTIAFGGKSEALPGDGNDLAACYRTVIRLPDHLITAALIKHLRRCEKHVRASYPTSVLWARKAAKWPGLRALRARAGQS